MQTAKIVEFPEVKPTSGKRSKRQHKAENRLEPTQVKIGGKDYWRVRIGSRLTQDRSKPPLQKYFRSKVEADTFIRQQLTLLRNQGTAAFSLSDEQRVTALNAFRSLAEVGATLKEAVDYFLLHARPSGGVVTFCIAVSRFITSRELKNCKKGYLRNLRSQCQLLCEPAMETDERNKFRKALPKLNKQKPSTASAEAQPAQNAQQKLKERKPPQDIAAWEKKILNAYESIGENLGTQKVNEIKKPILEMWLAQRSESEGWEAKTRNNYIVTLRAMWTFFIREKWCVENVADAIDKAILDDVPTAIFTPDEARQLLAVAAQCFEGALTPAIAIGLFAGLRRSEICALDWREVKDSSIEVTAAKAKTRRRRIVDIQPNLGEWLAPFRKLEGPVFEGNEDKFEEKRKHLAAEAGLGWQRNVLRHSAASYHLAHFGNENHTALQMGHSPQVLIDHYREVVTKSAAAEYWEIAPRTVDLDEAACKRFGRDGKRKSKKTG